MPLSSQSIMISSQLWIGLCWLLANVASSSATIIEDRVKGFTVHQSSSRPGWPGPVAHEKLLRKYNATVPSPVLLAARQVGNTNANVVATPEAFDAAYLCPVTIGGQNLDVNFDTGSADLWVFSSETPGSQRMGHSFYDPYLSTNTQVKGYSWDIVYGDGSGASGDVYSDVLRVGDVSVTAQSIERAYTVSAQFENNVDFDGVLGLAFNSINTVVPQRQQTFFDNAVSQRVISDALFTVDLKKGAPGTFTFGYINNTKHTGPIIYTPVDSRNGFWKFTSDGYAIGNYAFASYSDVGIADTGTTLILLDPQLVDNYWSNVTNAFYSNVVGAYIFPCTSTLPDLTIGIAGSRFTIPGPYMNYAPLSSTACYGGLQANDDIGISIYGNIFLKSVFAVFDRTNMRFGVATKNI